MGPPRARPCPAPQVLRHELAELYSELKKYDQAQAELSQLLDHLEGAADKSLDDMCQEVRSLVLLARVHRERGALQDAVAALARARATQASVISRVRVEAPDQLGAQRDAAADVAYQLADCHEQQRDAEQAAGAYSEALKHNDAHEKAILALARLQLSRGELEAAQELCMALMRIDGTNREASMILADLMLQKSEWEAAIFHFQQLLERAPANFEAIVKLLQLLRRAGRLKEAPRALAQAEHSSPRAALEPGFRFCQGLLHRYTNDPRAALKAFNFARREGEWAERALTNMVEVYLNPENETNWDELQLDARHEGNDAVRAAERLLRELPQSPRREVLESYALMAHRSKPQVEKVRARAALTPAAALARPRVGGGRGGAGRVGGAWRREERAHAPRSPCPPRARRSPSCSSSSTSSASTCRRSCAFHRGT